MTKQVGILTSGGDCPGLNAVIRAVARRCFQRGYDVIAVREGWGGLIDGHFKQLGTREISGILHLGGTIIGTSRRTPFGEDGAVDRVCRNWGRQGLDALVVIGGEGSLSIAERLHREQELEIVAVPKTIDNDLSATDYTFGFDTAVAFATEAIDRLHSTAEAHNRVIVVEVMGRSVGWIGVVSGIAGGADVILIPEHPITVEHACRLIEQRHNRGHAFSIVVVSEGFELKYESGGKELVAHGEDDFGRPRLGGVGAKLAEEIEARTGFETRVTALGYVQRGGTPTARDRVLATRFGVKAADLVHEGRFGRMVALQGDTITDVPLAEAIATVKIVPPEWYELAAAVGG